MTLLRDMQKVLRENVREYGMFIALLVIIIVFTITTKGLFISSRNIVNLVNQTGYVAVLAVGMTLVIIAKHIDLSVGFLAGFLGAVAAISMTAWNQSVPVTIVIVLALGVLAGLLTAFLVAQLGIPAFVATLAGWLGYRGAEQLVTVRTGTIIIPNESFNAIGNGFIPDIPGLAGFLPHLHKLTLLIGVIGIILYIRSALNDRRRTQAYHFGVLPLDMFIAQLVIMSSLIGGIMWILAGYQGLSWTAVVVLIVALSYDFSMWRTTLGRHIYAVGGNPQAAELSGISVKTMTYVVFASMGLLSALSGMLYAARLRSATTIAGTLFELDAIAAAFVGGASSSGGVGKVMGSIIGAVVMASLTNGMNLMGIDLSMQYIVRALVLAAAVIFDVTTRSKD